MTLLTYNILTGANGGRLDAVCAVIDAAAPDSDTQLEGFVGRVRADAEAAGRAAGMGPSEGFKLLDKV